jgi:transcriptional regulator with XRE-family HTH domain
MEAEVPPEPMSSKIATLLGTAVREIRKRTTKTQDAWQAKTGMSQSYLSAAERGESGWSSIDFIADAIEKAGGDPLDVLRIAARQLELAPDEAELLRLWEASPEYLRETILKLLRGHHATSAKGKSSESR